MADVFVSYSRKDSARVEMLVRALEAHGLSVWWDRSLEQGQDFGQLIRAEIRAARAVVVCWSEAAADSTWVQAEADEGSHQEKYVGSLIAPGRAPMPFNTKNNANLQAWAGAADDMQLLNLLKEVGRLAERQDIADRAQSMKRALDDQDARERAAEQAKRAEALRAADDQRAAEERTRMQNMAADTAAFFLLALECQRFKDEKSFLEAGRSWRSPDGSRRTVFCWAFMIAAVLGFVAWVATGGITFFEWLVLLVGVPTVFLGAAALSLPLNRFVFNEPARWWRHPQAWHETQYRFGRMTKKEINAFRDGEHFQRLYREYTKRPDLTAMFANRTAMWAGWGLINRGDLRENLERHIEWQRQENYEAIMRRR